ncbi:disulfide bond formation protein DsbA [Planctomycetaceae bacterium SCGC AG-212-F19]|nr:disulfide bond formation protein DsbA [Planctomycetaceae bacterium SCGC AG-212-F19]
MNLTVDVISDVICPWGYIGKRRLEKAIATRRGQHDVRVRWHPFQLYPDMPKEGMNRKEYRTGKFGTWERSLALDAQVVTAGAEEGIAFNFDQMTHTPNTLDAHRLIWLADRLGVQDAVVEAVFRAYFTEGQDISKPQSLLDVTARAGLDRGRAEGVLTSDDGLVAMRAAEEQARSGGVQGVPFFVVNKIVALSGAVGSSAFLNAFDQAEAESVVSEGSVCNIGAGEERSC